MKDKNNDKKYEITDEDFFTTLWKFERKKIQAYDFITKAAGL